MKPTSQSLTIAATAAAVLTPAQKKFNSLIRKIEKQRESLQEWQEAEPLFAQRWNAEFVPLQQEHDLLQLQLARTLDRAIQDKGIRLSKKQLATARAIIADITQTLLAVQRLDTALRAAVRELHDAHHDLTYDEIQRETQQAIREQMQGMFGIELDENEAIDLNDPAAMLRRIGQAMQAQMENAAAEKPEKPRTKAQTRREAARLKKQQEQEAFEQQASQSVQNIFRRLASSLHPDREKDPQERERKTELMQRANAAYNNNRLLDLLQLQLEVEQLDPGTLVQMADQQLKHFIHMLQQQSDDLAMELMARETGFQTRYGLDPERTIRPRDMQRIVTESVFFQQQDMAESQSLLDDLKDPKALKQWLNESRQEMDADAVLDPWASDMFFSSGGLFGR